MKKLPKIALGTWSWGTGANGGDAVFGNSLSDEQMKSVFETAVQSGLNLWDTAAVYGMGDSEKALGKLIRGYSREDLILSTKFTPNIADEQAAHPVSAMLEESLDRLGVNNIDIYWIHSPKDVEKWTTGLIPLLQAGKVKSVGVSNHNLAQIKRANEILRHAGYSVSAVQNHYSLLYRSSEDAGILEYCKENDITFFAYMVLEQGALSGRYNPQNPMPEGSGRAETYNKILPQLQASELIRSLLKSDRPSSLAQAIIEAGRINKTLYLLNYIDDEDYRRRILTQLNRGESRHAVARAICHGQRGEIRKRYREGQEDQLGSLGLVTNAVVLWNTIYMQAALEHVERQGETLKNEDIARLSPLSHKHVNMLGHYSFTLTEQVLNGELRPLKQPSDQDDFA